MIRSADPITLDKPTQSAMAHGGPNPRPRADSEASGLDAGASAARVLIADDDPIVADSLAELLGDQGHTVATAAHGAEAMAMLNDRADTDAPFQVVLVDLNLPRLDGMAMLKEIRRHHPRVSVVMMTGYATVETAVEAVKRGAVAYLTKPIADDAVLTAVVEGLQQHLLLTDSAQQARDDRAGAMGITGRDHKMQRIYELIESVAASRTTVLVTGESGTGKSMVAQAIHQQSDRAKRPLVTMACGSIPETLLESELFGHRKGAFTGADRDKEGKLHAAEGGTLFIDEINSATPALQLKLLRVLQERVYEPVGSHETRKADVRFVLATNEPLKGLVEAGQFREDLFYRINVVNLELPPLRQREADIPLLAGHFLRKYTRETGKVIRGISDEVMTLFRRYRWPGNVRELENALERGVVLSRADQIEPDVLPEAVRFQQSDGEPGFRERRKNPQGWTPAEWTPRPLREALAEPERQIILAALRAHDWNRQHTAAALDINRTTLYKKIKQYGLEEMELNL